MEKPTIIYNNINIPAELRSTSLLRDDRKFGMHLFIQGAHLFFLAVPEITLWIVWKSPNITGFDKIIATILLTISNIIIIPPLLIIINHSWRKIHIRLDFNNSSLIETFDTFAQIKKLELVAIEPYESVNKIALIKAPIKRLYLKKDLIIDAVSPNGTSTISVGLAPRTPKDIDATLLQEFLTFIVELYYDYEKKKFQTTPVKAYSDLTCFDDEKDNFDQLLRRFKAVYDNEKILLLKKLSEFEDEKVIAPLAVELLNTNNEALQFAILKVMRDLKYSSSQEHIIEFIKNSPSKDLIKMASTTLANLHPLDTKGLISTLNEKNQIIKLIVIDVLGDKISSEAVEPLIELIHDKDYDIRIAIAVAFGKIKDPRVFEPLIKLLDDQNVDVKWAAIESLRNLGDIKAIGPLKKLIEEENKELKIEIEETIMELENN